MNIVEVEHLRKNFGDIMAVRDICFQSKEKQNKCS